MKYPKTAIVTNSYKRPKELVQKSILASMREAKDFPVSIIFIDQSNVSDEFDIQIISFDDLKIIKSNKTSVSSARNLLLNEDLSNFEWLIFCDDDGYMEENYLDTFYRIINEYPTLEAIAGSIVRDDNFHYYSPRHRIGGSLKNFRQSKLLMGSNFAVKTKVFQELKGFDENFGAGAKFGAGEETDFCWKCYFQGINMEWFQKLRIMHVKPYAGTLEHSLKKAYNYGVGKGSLVRKWLFGKKKLIVSYELAEMLMVPILQIIVSTLTLRLNKVQIHFSSLRGRVMGLLGNYKLK